MKNIHKNPLFYYILALIIAALFPAVIWGVYLPGVRANLNNDKEQFIKAQQIIDELLTLDPRRLDFAQEKGKSADFDYATAVQQAAMLCSVPSGNYKLSAGAITKTGGQKSQSANVSLKDVDITKATTFLSTIQLRWSGLQCTKIAMKKKKGLPDSWDVDFTFKYLY
jgi:hypothetical protein